MSTEQEHEIVPAIRDWLAATSDAEIPYGLSRKDAHRRAREFLAAILVDTPTPDEFEADDDLNDILWASVEELEENPLNQPSFEECDRLYQFVGALRVKDDPLDERGEALGRMARIGWRSAPGGLEAVLKARDAIWEHGDEKRHREVCETADQLFPRIKALTGQSVPSVTEIIEVCARLVKLSGISPSLVVPAADALTALLADPSRRIGRLDDREHLKGVTALAAAMANRNLGLLDSARSGHAVATSAFRRTAESSDLDRVEVECLALQHARRHFTRIAESGPALIQTLVIPRERIKAQMILAQSLINLDRPQEARLVLESVRQDPVFRSEPTLQAWLLSRLGVSLSYLGEDVAAVAAFNSAGVILRRFYHPVLLADLTGAVGRHLGERGKLTEAIALYLAAREEFQRVGQAQLVGYYSVLVAEVMMLLGRNEEAEAELLAALPLIEMFDLRQEAIAAVAILRQALSKHQPDVTAIQMLRDQLRKGLHW